GFFRMEPCGKRMLIIVPGMSCTDLNRYLRPAIQVPHAEKQAGQQVFYYRCFVHRSPQISLFVLSCVGKMTTANHCLIYDTRRTENVTTYLGYFSRSEEHTSELQSRENLVCRLLLEKKNIIL